MGLVTQISSSDISHLIIAGYAASWGTGTPPRQWVFKPNDLYSAAGEKGSVAKATPGQRRQRLRTGSDQTGVAGPSSILCLFGGVLRHIGAALGKIGERERTGIRTDSGPAGLQFDHTHRTDPEGLLTCFTHRGLYMFADRV